MNAIKQERILGISIDGNSTIISALKLMDKKHLKLLLILDGQRFVSLLSIGDIQRAIISAVPMETPVSSILRDKVSFAHVTDSKESVIEIMKKRRIEFMPIVDDKGDLFDVIFWNELFETEQTSNSERFNLPVVIMAGGQGSRLRPLTSVLPKPLIPIGEQTMLEDIMERFASYGCSKFYISVNYKADFIRHYFDNFAKLKYSIEFFQEDKPLGTAGSLHMLKDRINSSFFVSNCDSIIDENYAEILAYHRANKNEITVVSALKTYSIPYGTLETGDNGLLKSIHEKPELTFKINTGVYLLEPHLLSEIPVEQFYHITFLIDKLTREQRKVGVFPISEGSWIDIGNWEEYLNYIKQHGHGE